MKILVFIILIFSSTLYSQSLSYVSEFGNFSSAFSFDVDLQGNIYITDISENTITKIDSSGNLINTIGGYGWSNSSFDEPVNIVTTTLSIYVCDKNNSRIQRFDKDLNYLSEYSGTHAESEVEFGYPSCLDISNLGDLYLLDSDNNRILKFSLTGKFLLEIGANDAGGYALTNPNNFSIDKEGNIFVLDENRIKVFDQYGNGQFIFKTNYNPKKIYSYMTNLLYIENDQIVIFNLKERKIAGKFCDFFNLENEVIVDAKIIAKHLFILTPHRILKYKVKF